MEVKNKKIKKRKKQNKKVHPAVKALKIVGTVLLSAFLVVIITGSIFATVLTIYILNFADTSTTISLDRVADGSVTRFLSVNPKYDKKKKDSQKYELYYAMKNDNKHFVWVNIEDIPQHVQDAFVYTEDERFYAHDGVDFKRTFAAIIRTLMGTTQGGSTITQQTIKQITGEDERSGFGGIERKFKEIFRSINVEKSYTKEDILQSYLNVIPLGNKQDEIIGIQAAANFYFGKDVKDLSLLEAASLAGMTNSPANYNPYNGGENDNGVPYNKIRREYTLKQMLENGAISDDEYETAMSDELKVVGNFEYSSATVYEDETKEQGPTSYFMDAAINQAVDIIAENAGITTAQANERLLSGGYTVYTTVDRTMQSKVEKAMQTASNFTTYAMDPSQDKLWSGFIAMDYEGRVKAVVGGRKKKTESRTLSTATDTTRSPGSCVKPIASYAPALDQDIITWSSLYNDAPITYQGKQWPVNYSEDGASSNWSYNNLFTWQMLMRSLNTMPAQLIEKMTPAYSYNFLKNKLDVTTLTKNDADYSAMTVGGMSQGMHLEELVGAYMIFGNGGKKYDVTYISKIEQADGTVIFEKNDGYKQAVSESTSYIMNRMMQYVINDPQGTGREAKLQNTDLVGKTGTTTNWNDLNFVGCTPDYVSGIWIGYEYQDRIPTNEYQNIAAIWKNIFGDIAENEKHKSFDDTFKMPDSVEQKKYCTRTGLLAGNGCYNTNQGYYKKTNEPGYCNGAH